MPVSRAAGVAYSSRGLRGFFPRTEHPTCLCHLRRMLADVRRFLTRVLSPAPASSTSPWASVTSAGTDDRSENHFIVPTPADRIHAFPVDYLPRQPLGPTSSDAPRRRVVSGGSAQLSGRSSPHSRMARADPRGSRPVGVTIATAAGGERFDAVGLATHADEDLRLLLDADARAADLGGFEYSTNAVVLHSRLERVLPANPRARASWNVSVGCRRPGDPLVMTYHMERLCL